MPPAVEEGKSMSEVQFIVATDGSTYLANPGPGAYGYIIRGYLEDKLVLEKTAAYIVGGESTSNRMEMAAILFAIYQVQNEMESNNEECSPVVEIVSDSQNAISWLTGKFNINEPAIREYARDIRQAIKDAGIEVKYTKVTGHSKVHQGMTRDQKMNCKVDTMLRDIWKER